MKALVLKEYRRFAVEDFAVPVLQTDEVLVRVRACGICGSDVHGMDGSSGRRIPPIIMGHEAAGEISQIGTCASAGEYPECLDLIASGKINVTEFISATPRSPRGRNGLNGFTRARRV